MPVGRDLKTCQSCGSSSGVMYVCDRCLVVNYCSQRCCDRDWKNHKDDCRFYTWQQRHACLTFCQFCLTSTCRHSSHFLQRCGGCLMVSYCSPSCQMRDWAAHGSVCPGNKNQLSDQAEVDKKKKTTKRGKEKETDNTPTASGRNLFKEAGLPYDALVELDKGVQEYVDAISSVPLSMESSKLSVLDLIKIKIDLGLPLHTSDLTEHYS